jgi:crotonobetainyl-CoA:carnitine CoA-transferase CaiB-like acyl-CoA transferase
MSKPLEGIRVLEITNIMAGPFAGMLLADMGADVIKVEALKGDMARAFPPLVNGESVSFSSLNRNKRSLAIDLKNPKGLAIVRGLAEKADVVLENNRPGALAKLGLGPDDLKKANPKLVYVSVSAFGQTGPERRRGGINIIAEAASGVMSIYGEPGKMPMRPAIQTADLFAAMFATYAALAGLVGAARLGEGRTADVCLTESILAAATWEASGFLVTGEVPERVGHRHRLNAPNGLFATRDGRYIAIGSPNDPLFIRMLEILDLHAFIGDPRFASYSLRKVNEDALLPLFEAAILKWDAADLEKVLGEAGVPASVVRTFKEALEEPQMVERKMVAEADHPKFGRLKMIRNPVLMDHDGPDIRYAPPLLGQHTEEVLREIGFTPGEIADLAKEGAVKLMERPETAKVPTTV